MLATTRKWIWYIESNDDIDQIIKRMFTQADAELNKEECVNGSRYLWRMAGKYQFRAVRNDVGFVNRRLAENSPLHIRLIAYVDRGDHRICPLTPSMLPVPPVEQSAKILPSMDLLAS